MKLYHSTIYQKVTRGRARSALSLIGILIFSISSVQAKEQSVAKYRVSVSGIPVARIVITTDTNDTNYAVRVEGKVTGLANVVSKGVGNARSTGIVSETGLKPASFNMITQDKRKLTSQFNYDGTKVSSINITPAIRNPEQRVALTDEHKAGILDPLSALVIKSDKGLGPHLCDRTVPVFDGRQRYDFKLSYKRTDQARGGKKSYNGPSILCKVRFVPIAGHRKKSKTIKYMQSNEQIFVWFVPMREGSKFFIPYRINSETLIGKAVMRMYQLK